MTTQEAASCELDQMSEVKLTTGEPGAGWEGRVATPQLPATHMAWETHTHTHTHARTHRVWLQMAWQESGCLARS